MGIPLLSHRKKFALLIALMAAITVGVAGITLAVLYNTAYREQTKHLVEIAQTKARWIEVIAQYYLRTYPGNPDTAYQATIEQVRAAQKNFSPMGDSGEITLAKMDRQQVQYVLSDRSDSFLPHGPPANSHGSVAMRRALAGESGLTVGKDYRGVKVLAAFEPVGEFGLGLVAKVDFAELEAPFIRAGIHSAAFGLLFIVLGAWVFRRISSPMINSAEKTESQLNTILNTVVDGIVTTDINGVILSVNTSAEKMFGYSCSELVGQNVNLLMPTEFRYVHEQILEASKLTAEKRIIGISREVFGQRKDGTAFPIEIALGKAKIGEQLIYTGVIRDITDRRLTEDELKKHRENLEDQVAQRTEALARANRKLEQLARVDALTGIANRRVFDETLTQELRRSRRSAKPLSLLICDIDYFKNYNDTYGHVEGDRCLQTVAKVIESVCQRAGELVARYGGEEFAIILPSLEKPAALERAESIRAAIWERNLMHGSSSTQRVTVTLGVATISSDAPFNQTQLINAADNALYIAKNNGRNCVASDEHRIVNPGAAGAA